MASDRGGYLLPQNKTTSVGASAVLTGTFVLTTF